MQLAIDGNLVPSHCERVRLFRRAACQLFGILRRFRSSLAAHRPGPRRQLRPAAGTGQASGAFDTFIRTDSQWITKQPVPEPARNTRNLNYFSAIFCIGTGDNLSAPQKRDLMSFIKEDGKGFVGAHTGDDAFFDWPEFGEMIGGYFDGHPWGVFDAPVIVETPSFPAMKMFPARFTIRDEIYQHKDFSRDKVRVLARLDGDKLDYTKPNIHRTDRDFPVAWAKMHGKGRVFYSTFGHADEAWDNPLVQKMYLEALKWALRLEGEDVTPGK